VTDYEIRRGHWKNLDGDKLPALIEAHFGTVQKDGAAYVASFGALRSVRVTMKDKTTLDIQSETDRGADTPTQQRTIRAWNDFLEAVTGYNAKQRAKRAQEKAKAADVPDA